MTDYNALVIYGIILLFAVHIVLIILCWYSENKNDPS